MHGAALSKSQGLEIWNRNGPGTNVGRCESRKLRPGTGRYQVADHGRMSPYGWLDGRGCVWSASGRAGDLCRMALPNAGYNAAPSRAPHDAADLVGVQRPPRGRHERPVAGLVQAGWTVV